MKVKEFEVNYAEKRPVAKFESQAFGVSIRVQLGSESEQRLAEELATAFSKAKEIVRAQMADAE